MVNSESIKLKRRSAWTRQLISFFNHCLWGVRRETNLAMRESTTSSFNVLVLICYKLFPMYYYMLGPLASMGLLVVKMMLLLLRAHFLPSPSRSSLLFSPYVTIMTLQCALTMTIDMKVNLLCISSKRSNSQSFENWVVLFNHICLVLACSIVHFIGSIVMNLSRNLGLQKGFVEKKSEGVDDDYFASWTQWENFFCCWIWIHHPWLGPALCVCVLLAPYNGH